MNYINFDLGNGFMNPSSTTILELDFATHLLISYGGLCIHMF